MDVQNELVSRGLPGDTGNGASSPISLSSADGRFVVLSTQANNLIDGIIDVNNGTDVYLYDRTRQSMSLVSRSARTPTQTANEISLPRAISADGEWVLFQSSATNLVTGVMDTNLREDVFLYQRSTGMVSLVSRSAESAMTTANGTSFASAISADGEWVLFQSVATNLVAGVTDSNGSGFDVFLYRRSTGTVSLVSRAAMSAAATANNQSLPTAISADGEWVLFQSNATNLVTGVTDTNSREDVFLYQRSTGVVNLVSRSAESAMTTANGTSLASAISADGEWVLFQSVATNVVAGVTDGNRDFDGFLYQRGTGAVSLISRSAELATTTANSRSNPTAISANGEWVLFRSEATDLVAGQTDGTFTRDVFLYERGTGAISLVSRSTTSTTTTANSNSQPIAISADGEWVLFSSVATNLVSGVTDSIFTEDAFLYQRSRGAVSLISRSAESATMTANNRSNPTAISADGEWVLFRSDATDLIAGVTDSNGLFPDVFLYQRSTGATSLVSRSATSTATTASSYSTPIVMSADGEWVLFESQAPNLVSGVTDSNGSGFDVFLYRRSTGAVSLVSRSATSATTTANGSSRPRAISDDGKWVLFSSSATNLVSGVSDINGGFNDVFLYQRTTGAVSLVSRSAASAARTANGFSRATAISANGEWVLFDSSATDVVSGVTDINAADDVFLYQRSTGAVSLVSRSATSAARTANSFSMPTAISANGEWVLFSSFATDLVNGVADRESTSDVFLYQRSTGAVSLMSRSAASPSTTGNNSSGPIALSPEGEWVLFTSRATDLVTGVTDSNNTEDVFLYQRSTEAVSLVSRSAMSATTANGSSSATAMSADAEWVLFGSAATNLVPGLTDGNSHSDAFLYQRSTGTVSLVSRSATSATTTANGSSGATAISADAEWVLFGSLATNLVSGLTDTNGGSDVFLYQRGTGAISLLSRSATSATTTANGSSGAAAISVDAEFVLFSSFASDVVGGVLDGNAGSDIFLGRNPVDSLFGNGFEAP